MNKVKPVEKNQNDGVEVVKQKRGRKPKKDLVEIAQNTQISQNIQIEQQNVGNISIIIQDNDNDLSTENNNLIDEEGFFPDDTQIEEPKQGNKKRGRKPKGGKIIQNIVQLTNNKEQKPNIILHLKCSLKDLQSNTLLSSNIESFNFSSNKNNIIYEIINSNENKLIQNNYNSENNITQNNIEFEEAQENEIEYEHDNFKNKDSDNKEVWKKLKVLEHNLHINNISDKKSACFWCTCEFDNPPVYIPKHYIKNSYHVYGCFCSPECATAHLMEENIDSSSKFERYHLLNHIYSKIYDYKKNIKPAPNPFYLLDKYYGNLSIQEFRSLLRNERLFLVVDKPLTRILPELHEDNDDFIINNKIIPANSFSIKKKLQRKHQTKTNIVNEKFGVSSI
jgi:hypothetical protein